MDSTTPVTNLGKKPEAPRSRNWMGTLNNPVVSGDAFLQ